MNIVLRGQKIAVDKMTSRKAAHVVRAGISRHNAVWHNRVDIGLRA